MRKQRRKAISSWSAAGAPEDVAHATISAMRLYDTGVVLPAAGGVMTPLLNLRTMAELDMNKEKSNSGDQDV